MENFPISLVPNILLKTSKHFQFKSMLLGDVSLGGRQKVVMENIGSCSRAYVKPMVQNDKIQ